MSKYIVVALSVGAKSNKIFYAGEEVSGDAFDEGHAEALVEQGFLKPIETEGSGEGEGNDEGNGGTDGDKAGAKKGKANNSGK